MNKIEKKWCAYGCMTPFDLGLVIEEGHGSCYILYSEGQYYPAECWDNHYVKRFETIDEAVVWTVEHSDNYEEQVWESAWEKFPKELKKDGVKIKKNN